MIVATKWRISFLFTIFSLIIPDAVVNIHTSEAVWGASGVKTSTLLSVRFWFDRQSTAGLYSIHVNHGDLFSANAWKLQWGGSDWFKNYPLPYVALPLACVFCVNQERNWKNSVSNFTVCSCFSCPSDRLDQGCQTKIPGGCSVCRFLWFPFNWLSIKALRTRCVDSVANQLLACTTLKTSRHCTQLGLEFDTKLGWAGEQEKRT